MIITNLNLHVGNARQALVAFATAALLLISTTPAKAEPITREQARQRAEAYLKTRSGSKHLKAVEASERLSPRRHVRKIKGLTADALDLYYVFDRGTDEGYVIVSGDDRTAPVLGYTDHGHFDYAQLPPNMISWLTGYEDELEALRSSDAPIVGANVPTHDPVEQLCTSKWNQGDPYNQSCPMYFTLGRSVTGCVATAMAQILYYHRSKMVTETQATIPAYQAWAEKPYNNQYLQVEAVPEGSPIDWANMTDTYNSSSSAKQKKAVADLMWYCGASVEMGYTNSSSGANSYKVANALPKYFGFGESVKYHYKEGESMTEEQWDAIIYKEIADSRPVYLSGANKSGGHAFVADGYDGNQCYHINWGWGGSSDGFYMLSKLNPGSQGIGGSDGGYSDQREIVIGIEPINFSTRAIPFENATLKRICTEAFDKNADGTLTYGEVAEVTDLGDHFKGKGFTTFTELYNFTGLTAIADEAFSGCSRLTNVKLPKSVKTIGARAFADCRVLKEINLPADLTSIGEGAFSGCAKLPNLTLPSSITEIAASSFEGCTATTAVVLPLGIKAIGSRAFAGCTKLTSFTVNSVKPEQITLGADVWADIDLSKATLHCLQGSRQFFTTATQWRDFGNLYEKRTLGAGHFATLETSKDYYIYNVGLGRYLTNGEAYGTQAVVADTDKPMRFQLRRTTNMAEGLYYIYTSDPINSNHIFFRTNTDGKVGAGINACFVDGPASNNTKARAHWQVALVDGETNVYTFQVPEGVSGYSATKFLGVQPSHDSNAASPTYGTYSDIEYADFTSNCQWMLVTYDAAQQETYKRAARLENLLNAAKKKRMDCTLEEAVYADFNATDDDIDKACQRLRKKLNLVNFADDAFRDVCLNSIDADSDGEISYDEAASITDIDEWFKNNKNILTLEDLKYFTGAEYILARAFNLCSKAKRAIVPESVKNIYTSAFMACSALESVELPLTLQSIGNDVFSGCTHLKEVRVAVADPASILLGTNVFKSVPVSEAVLYVPYGSKDLYAQADVWKEFGTIREMRAVKLPGFAELEPNKDFYIYNLGERAYINKGEAYGTQAVVASKGLVYQLHRTANMPEDTYYMQSLDLGTDANKNVLFRTSTDTNVGKGIKACFVDHSVGASSYWTFKSVGNNIYTIQVPSNQADYVEGEYFGTDRNHETDYTYYDTYGIYWDIPYNEASPAAAQWAFIDAAKVKEAYEEFNLSEKLKALLTVANEQNVNVVPEQAVYDDFEATTQQIEDAITSVRNKLHYIDFADERVKTLAKNRWDLNDDDEISIEELADVSDINTLFKGVTAIKSLEDLQHFSALTAIPEDAFRGNTNMQSAILPAGVRSIGTGALANTSKLQYLAILNPASVVDGTNSGLTVKQLTLFVPTAMVDAYKADEFWGKYDVQAYTGVPTVTVETASRQYGRSNPKFTYKVSGAPVTGEPELTCAVELTTPVGDYDIEASTGTVISRGVQFVNGTLTIVKAPVTVTAQSYTRAYGEENPTFEAKYSSLRNREKIDEVLTAQPVFECDATAQSYAGEYEIRVSGCEADNYEFTYVSGKLTIQGGPDAIRDIDNGKSSDDNMYDIAGRKVNRTQNGVYIRNGKKVAKTR